MERVGSRRGLQINGLKGKHFLVRKVWEPPPTNPLHYIMQQNGQLQRWNPSSWALLIKYSLHKCTIDLIILCID